MSFNKSIYEELILESNDQQRTVDIRNGTLAIQYFEDICAHQINDLVKETQIQFDYLLLLFHYMH